jgi:hypothetical protein
MSLDPFHSRTRPETGSGDDQPSVVASSWRSPLGEKTFGVAMGLIAGARVSTLTCALRLAALPAASYSATRIA